MFEYAVETPFPTPVPVGFSATETGTETLYGTPAVVARIDDDGVARLWTGYFGLTFAVELTEAELVTLVDEVARSLNRWPDGGWTVERPVPYADDDSWQAVAALAYDYVQVFVADARGVTALDLLDLGYSPLADYLREYGDEAAISDARVDEEYDAYRDSLYS